MILELEEIFAVLDRLPLASLADLRDPERAIDRRRWTRFRTCAFCGDPAPVALLAHRSSIVPTARWVDLCAPHDHAIRALFRAGNLTDAEISKRYARWRAR